MKGFQLTCRNNSTGNTEEQAEKEGTSVPSFHAPWSGSSWPSPVSHFLPDPVSSPHFLIDIMLQPWWVTYSFTNLLDGVPPPCLSTYFPLHLGRSPYLVFTTLSSCKTPVHPLRFYSGMTSSCLIFLDSTSLLYYVTVSLIQTFVFAYINLYCYHLFPSLYPTFLCLLPLGLTTVPYLHGCF